MPGTAGTRGSRKLQKPPEAAGSRNTFSMNMSYMSYGAYTGIGYINSYFKKMLSKITFIEILDNISDKTTNKRES